MTSFLKNSAAVLVCLTMIGTQAAVAGHSHGTTHTSNTLRSKPSFTAHAKTHGLAKAKSGLAKTGVIKTGSVKTGTGKVGNINTGNVVTGAKGGKGPLAKVNNGGITTGNVTTGKGGAGNINTGNVKTGKGNTGGVKTGDVKTGTGKVGNINTGNVLPGDVKTGKGKGKDGDPKTGGVKTGDVTTNGPAGDINTGNINSGNVTNVFKTGGAGLGLLGGFGGFGGGGGFVPAAPVVAAPAPVVEAPAVADLEPIEVKQMDAGDPQQGLGPRFRVTVANLGTANVNQEFTVGLAPSNAPRMGQLAAARQVAGLNAGDTTTVDIRLPMGTNFAFLGVAVDNHTAILAHDAVPMVASR